MVVELKNEFKSILYGNQTSEKIGFFLSFNFVVVGERMKIIIMWAGLRLISESKRSGEELCQQPLLARCYLSV